jgi:glutathione S-transferase
MVKYQGNGKPPDRPVPRLYVILGSHACRAAMLMLEHKGLSWRQVEVPTGFQLPAMRALGFPGGTVPALKLDGTRVQTNREIARFLDELEPDPPLLPRHRLSYVEDAERFADEVLQPLARRLVLAAGRRDLGSLAGHGESGRLGPILGRRDGRRKRIMRIAARYFRITDEREALDLAALPGVLGYVEQLTADGVLDGAEINAADCQIAPSIALLAYRLDMRAAVEASPGWGLVERLMPPRGRFSRGRKGSSRAGATV